MDKELLDDTLPTGSRVVRVFSTRSRKKIDSSAETWKQLKEDLRANDVPFSGMKAAIGKSKLSLEHPDAQLPTGDFVLYLMPKKTKSGQEVEDMKYSELRSTIKGLVDQSPNAKAHFNNEKNYTNKKTDDLKQLLREWYRDTNSFKADVMSYEEIKASMPLEGEWVAKSGNIVTEVEEIAFVQEGNETGPLETILAQLEAYRTSNPTVLEYIKQTRIDIQNAIDVIQLENSPEEQERLAEEKAAEELAEEIRLEDEKLAEEKKLADEAEWKDIESEANKSMCGFEGVECDDEFDDEFDEEDDY